MCCACDPEKYVAGNGQRPQAGTGWYDPCRNSWKGLSLPGSSCISHAAISASEATLFSNMLPSSSIPETIALFQNKVDCEIIIYFNIYSLSDCNYHVEKSASHICVLFEMKILRKNFPVSWPSTTFLFSLPRLIERLFHDFSSKSWHALCVVKVWRWCPPGESSSEHLMPPPCLAACEQSV
jgi:hypothetical protein